MPENHTCTARIEINVIDAKVELSVQGCKGGILRAFIALLEDLEKDPRLATIFQIALDHVMEDDNHHGPQIIEVRGSEVIELLQGIAKEMELQKGKNGKHVN